MRSPTSSGPSAGLLHRRRGLSTGIERGREVRRREGERQAEVAALLEGGLSGGIETSGGREKLIRQGVWLV